MELKKMKTKQSGLGNKQQLDCTECKRGVWLVKVPKYLSEHWRSLAGQGEVGRLNVVSQTDNRTGMTKDEVLFKTTRTNAASTNPGHQDVSGNSFSSPSTSSWPRTSAYDPAASSTPPGGGRGAVRGGKDLKKGSGSVPDEHKFVIGNTSHLTLAVCSEDKTDLVEELEESEGRRTGRLCLEGRVVKRAECRPPTSQNYMKMKISHIEDCSRPTRSIQQMEKAVIKFKPVAIHSEMVAREKQKKEGKAIRMDKDRVMEMLFAAFEKHQYYKLVDLAKITNQPPSYIKELLNEIGRYNTAPPHKYLWELKPEYRHYKGDQEEMSVD